MPEQYDANCCLEAKATLGEGSIWDYQAGLLWWIDIVAGRLHQFDPATAVNKTWEIGQYIGTVVPRNSGGLVLALQHGFGIFDPGTGHLEMLQDPESHLPTNRFNEGKCDPAGRFWAGTMSLREGDDPAAGSLYCLDQNGSCQKKLSDVTISNGIVWTSDHKTMYYIDSPTRRVDRFDYDRETGAIGNRRAAFELPEGIGYPDGMTIDSEDKLWVALWSGWAVARFDPASGELLARVSVDAANVTSCAFGGPALQDLFITTARHHLATEALEQQPHAGDLFRVSLPYRGVRAFSYAG